MKALVIAAALVTATSLAPAGAERDTRAADTADKTTTTVIADAGRIGTTGLTSLNGAAAPWSPTAGDADLRFDHVADQVDAGMLLVALGLAAVALARPLGRVLRRQEQHRRATALASTLGHSQRS